MQQVVAAIIYVDGKLLVQEHKKTGLLTVPSGSVEPNETPLEALHREMQEELGVGIHSVKFIRRTTRAWLQVEEFMYRVELDGPWVNAEPEKHPWMGELPVKNIVHHPLGKTEMLKSALQIIEHYEHKRIISK